LCQIPEEPSFLVLSSISLGLFLLLKSVPLAHLWLQGLPNK
jgi:hypothetical protein